ncbi:hypothetical protein ACFOKI_02590 [Sphingomonas qilianensis]|uniref:Uncharacterized protein n=1 Tax=Sphingomonas qilianensis TaxID=1736690 RepID=A0ABU9XRT0_9SPHN
MTESQTPPAYLFTPVRPTRAHANGWTADAQVAFIAALARTGVVAVAARSVGKSPRSAYQLRGRPGAESFADAWDRALDEGQTRTIDLGLSRALAPTIVPIFRHGHQIGRREKFDHGLAIAALRALDGANGRWFRRPSEQPTASLQQDRAENYLARFLGEQPSP